MKLKEVYEFMDDCIVKNFINFGYTLSSEFLINWKTQNLYFFGQNVSYYAIKDKNNNYVDKDNLDADCALISFYYDTGNINTYHIDIILDESYESNKVKLQNWLLELKSRVLNDFITLSEAYYKEKAKLYDWSLIVMKHMQELDKILYSYKSSLMEPDGNIMSCERKQLITILNEFDKKYDEFWGK